MDLVFLDPVAGGSGEGLRAAHSEKLVEPVISRELSVDLGSSPAQPVSERIWTSLGDFSARYSELQKSSLAGVEVPPLSGDSLTDLRSSMIQSQAVQTGLLELQYKLNSSQSIFSVALSALGNVQQATKTLFQDR